MKRLANFNKFTLALVFTAISVISWGQTLPLMEPSEPYSTTNPYVISSESAWNTFASDVNGGYSYSGEIIKLTANITVSTMVGTESNPFSGTFDGSTGVEYNIYTLTFNYGTPAAHTDEEIVAPFRYTNGATIKYLQVDGEIHTDAGKESGLIGVNKRTSTNTTVERVIIKSDLYCYQSLWE